MRLGRLVRIGTTENRWMTAILDVALFAKQQPVSTVRSVYCDVFNRHMCSHKASMFFSSA